MKIKQWTFIDQNPYLGEALNPVRLVDVIVSGRDIVHMVCVQICLYPTRGFQSPEMKNQGVVLKHNAPAATS